MKDACLWLGLAMLVVLLAFFVARGGQPYTEPPEQQPALRRYHPAVPALLEPYWGFTRPRRAKA